LTLVRQVAPASFALLESREQILGRAIPRNPIESVRKMSEALGRWNKAGVGIGALIASEKE
jgi:hypothetical protein